MPPEEEAIVLKSYNYVRSDTALCAMLHILNVRKMLTYSWRRASHPPPRIGWIEAEEQ